MILVHSPTIRRKEMEAVLTCMVDEKVGPGDMNNKLLQYMKTVFPCDKAVAVRTLKTALSLILNAMELVAGSVVMISSLAPMWHYSVLIELGFTPLVVDVCQDTGLITSDTVNKHDLSLVKAILLHETMGILPDIDSLLELGVPIIEDISQSFGAAYTSEEDLQSSSPDSLPFDTVLCGTKGDYAILGLEEHDTITAGGGAIVFSCNKKGQTALKQATNALSFTEILPDINCALAFVQLKEYSKNEAIRKVYYNAFVHTLLATRHKTFLRQDGEHSTIYTFPVILNCGTKEVEQLASKKGVETLLAFDGSVVSLLSNAKDICPVAYSLYLRTVIFPLYPFLGQSKANMIARLIGTLP